MRNLEKSIGIAVETSGRVGSVCLSRGADVLEELRFSGKMKHSSELMPSVETVQLVLDRRRRARRQPPATPVRLPNSPRIQAISVTPHDLAEYDTGTPDDDDS